jgi:hypothetical protein
LDDFKKFSKPKDNWAYYDGPRYCMTANLGFQKTLHSVLAPIYADLELEYWKKTDSAQFKRHVKDFQGYGQKRAHLRKYVLKRIANDIKKLDDYQYKPISKLAKEAGYSKAIVNRAYNEGFFKNYRKELGKRKKYTRY